MATKERQAQLASDNPLAVVNLDAIAHNVKLLRTCAGQAEVMVVVKADGYGHGAGPVARVALASGAAELGVATVTEALALRREGLTAPILAWLHPTGTDFAAALTADVQLAISSRLQLAELRDAVGRTGITATVTIKVDTGLNRNGMPANEFPQLLRELRGLTAEEAVRVRGIMSHLSCGDEPENPTNDKQAQVFTQILNQARYEGVEVEVGHLSNSAATVSRPDLAFDMVRPGLAVYGLNPIPGRDDLDLVPAMTVKAPVALVKLVPAGSGVSYGHTWVARQDTAVALVSVGYADGVLRTLGGRIEVMINGRRRRSIGRVCMDQFVVDLGPGAPDVSPGDETILFGPSTSGEQTAQDWARLAGTINYEIAISPRGRISRTYCGKFAEN